MEVRNIVFRRGTTFDKVQICTLFNNDQRMLKLPRPFCIEAKIGLQRDGKMHALWHIDKGAARPDRAVQRGEFEEWEVEGARACLIASLESRGDSAGRMEENALGQAATGIRETADELIAALRAVTNERIAEAAQSMTLDTVYFLTGEDSKDE